MNYALVMVTDEYSSVIGVFYTPEEANEAAAEVLLQLNRTRESNGVEKLHVDTGRHLLFYAKTGGVALYVTNVLGVSSYMSDLRLGAVVG